MAPSIAWSSATPESPTDGQDESLQIDALGAAGCKRIFVDRASGAIRERPELTNALRDGEDVLIVWRFDRIVRSLRYLATPSEIYADARSGPGA